MSVSEVNSGPQGSGCWQGQGQGRAPVGAYAHPGLDGRKPVITSELRHPECHPRLGCRVVREPVQRPREVPCSARAGNALWGRGHTAAWKTEQQVGERETKFDPELSGIGNSGGGVCALLHSWCPLLLGVLPLSSRLEGPAASLPGHAQTQACPVDFRPGRLPALWRIAWNCCPGPSPSSSDALALELLHPSPTTTNLGFSGGWASAASPLVSLPPLPLAGLPVSGTQRRGCQLTDPVPAVTPGLNAASS